ncbi:hypothetical protein A2W32_03575 [candidate division WWE3 bacterium RBG_16_37_10]|uniref:Uncharacterized protein n=1 Tax=candidate division WWE3 bacterium RBG_16_37_10 TaxID=1802610 RepID=A0A1F4UTK1_UNCKA|nr:MAG: hypothetical protein A2W32_03575 [candidate division WWE3 bacterium RBG_16_37_10]
MTAFYVSAGLVLFVFPEILGSVVPGYEVPRPFRIGLRICGALVVGMTFLIEVLLWFGPP